jgi:hypothetical protein
VNLDPRMHRKKLFHFDTWMRDPNGLKAIDAETGEFSYDGAKVLDTIDGMVPSNKKHWWIYLGTIKPSRIELDTTAALMLPGIEYNLANAIEEGTNPERIKELTEKRDLLLSLPPETMLDLKAA